MKTIAIDIDDVISSFSGSFLQYHNETYGTNLTPKDIEEHGEWRGYYEKLLCKLLKDPDGENEYRRRFEEFLSTDAHAQGQTISPEVKHALLELKKHYNLVVITARDDSLREKTVAWLTSELPDLFDDMYFVSNWRYKTKTTKAEVCKRIGAEYLIDDNVEHCNTAAEEGIQAILFGNYGWNAEHPTHPEVKRIAKWSEIVEFFENKANRL